MEAEDEEEDEEQPQEEADAAEAENEEKAEEAIEEAAEEAEEEPAGEALAEEETGSSSAEESPLNADGTDEEAKVNESDIVVSAASDEDYIDVGVSVTYGQTEARTILNMINEFRTGDDAWYWKSDNTTKKYCSNLSELEYDYNLEAAAMQRAAEVAIYMQHIRPNGEVCSTVLGEDESGYTIVMGECLAGGQKTAEAAFEAWLEEDEDYSGQGHRRVILGYSNVAVGIGHATFKGYDCWVLNFSERHYDNSYTAPNDSDATVTVQVLKSAIVDQSVVPSVTYQYLHAGDSVSLPTLTTKISIKTSKNLSASGLKTVTIPYTWTSSNSSCVAVSGGKMIAKKNGTATLSTTVLDTTIEIPVTVTSLTDIGTCTIDFADSGTYYYCGSAIVPDLAVTASDGTVLAKGTDYTVSCSNNVNVGTATAVITGIGNYTNSVTKTFEISRSTQALCLSAPDLLVGETAQITSEGKTTLTYSSSNSSVVSVNSSGQITGKAVGSAVITVTAAATAGYYGQSDTITITVRKALTTPSLTSIYCTSSGTVKMTWGNISGAEEYWVYRKTGSGSWTKVGVRADDGEVSTFTFTDSNVTVGTTYTYTVRCVNWDGDYYFSSLYNTTGWTITVSKSTSSSTSLSTPALSSVSNTNTGVKVCWKSVSGAAKYRVFRKTGSGSWAKVADTTSTSYTDTTAKSGTTYAYTVRCINSAGTSYTSSYNTTGLTIKYLSAGKISSLTNTSKGITVKWGKVTGASGYYVYRKKSGGSYSKIATVKSGSTVSYTDTAVKDKNGKTYIYAVRAYYGSTKGGYTGKTAVRLTGVNLSSVKNAKGKKMTVKWKKNSKATGYQIQYSTSSNFSSGNKTVTVKGYKNVSKTISKLTKGKKYYVRIRVYRTVSGSNYYSAWSNTKNVKISK